VRIPPADSNRRVLVIDDNRAIHDDFRKILSPPSSTASALDAAEAALFGHANDAIAQAGFEVDSAYQGQEGVRVAAMAIEAGRPYAMAFVDVRMPPGWDGVETTAKLWQLDPHLQVVLCTAYADYSWGEVFDQLGQSDGLLILKKPFDAVEALQLAHALTEKWRLTRQAMDRQQDLEQRVHERTRDLQTANGNLAIATRRANELAATAQKASKAKGDFLAGMSHEIRTPMNGVMGMLELLSETSLSERQREFVQIARSSAEALLLIINDILDFSKIEAGKLAICSVPFDLQSAVQEVAEILGTRVSDKSLELIVHYAPDIPCQVIGDPGRIRQILTNLVGNALKFTAVGHVLITVECESRQEHKAQFKFSVEDTGIGISDAQQARLFQKFMQADTSTTRRFGGTGLGLAISRQLTELMGGTIGLTSQPGKGSTFWFTLPLDLPTPTTRMAPSSTLLDGVRVLIVDDNAVNRLGLHEQLSHWKMQSRDCASAKDALELLHTARTAGDPIQIAILDQQMPEMDGVMLARAIKSDPDLRETVLVMLTSMGQPENVDELKSAGIFACLSKPASPSKLWDVLAEAWAGHLEPSPASPTPAAHSSNPPEAVPRSAITRNRSIQANVLVTDDNATNRMVARLMLENLGCRVDVAANGQETIRMLELLPYDIVFMDCEMPDMDGYEATTAIRQRQIGKRRVPIVAMTAKAMQGDREHCLQAGMDDFLSKPVRSEDLESVLRRWVPQPATVDPAPPEIEPVPAPIPLESDLPPLDPEVTERLRRLADVTDPNMLNDIYEAYLSSGEKYLATLRQSAQAGDVIALSQSAHALKGASATVGASIMAQVSGQLEAFDHSQSMTEARKQIDQLEQEWVRVKLNIMRATELESTR
jgi:two-component system, sensor histidine kinase and response regulator